MLSTEAIERFLSIIPTRTIGIVGDLFLDRYLDCDETLTEPSLETGLDAYQVTRVRSYPGAAGTVINNLAAIGARRIVPISMIGEDGEGFELRQALARLAGVDLSRIITTTTRRTPTYTKPMLAHGDNMGRELNRLDIKNRLPLPHEIETGLIAHLADLWQACDAILVLDQVSEPECGVVTSAMRDAIRRQAEHDPSKFVIADSRERIRLFREVMLKPNERECVRASGERLDASEGLRCLATETRRPVICTRGEHGMRIAESGSAVFIDVPAYSVAPPIDIVGAGDSSSAAMACALASGATLIEAAAFGNLVASITIKQIGVTGTATPTQIRNRWQEV
ncbi:MAG: carbohydrate kinase [Gemmataceae bacterium]|nr:carbohydrate kinase [Gemmataceae bacterium]